MNRELFLLNPYRLPTQHTLMLSADDVAVFLNGYLSLWHPAALHGATAPPKLASAYDHEQPVAGHIYAVSDSPPLFLPDDWDQRVQQAGAIAFRATARREETQQNLLKAIGAEAGDPARSALLSSIGLGYLVLEALCEAMDHLNQLSVGDFWQDVQRAVEAPDIESCRQHLKLAAERLQDARRILYDSTTHLLDLAVLEDLPPNGPWPLALEYGTPTNFVASTQVLERLPPEWLERLRQGTKDGQIEIASGSCLEREDALLPVESQLWNLRAGVEAYRRLLGQELMTFGRRRFAASPHLPQFLHTVGLKQVVLLAFDEGVLPQFHSAAIEWYAPSGEQVKAFTRKPQPADSPLTYFHLAHYLSKTMQQDMVSSLAFLHRDKPETCWHRDWLELHRLAPVFGQFTTLNHFFSEVGHGEYTPARTADDFHSDYLHELTEHKSANPVSRFRDWSRLRRRLDDLGTVAGLYRGITKPTPGLSAAFDLDELIDRFERGESALAEELDQVERPIAAALSDRLLTRAESKEPGFLIINPCSFRRMMCVELDGVQTPLPAPARATQLDGAKARVVVEVPALGFTWLPQAIAPGTKVAVPKGKLAEGRIVRNEYLVAEVDGVTGGLRSIRDPRHPQGRLGQQLIYGPGSTMKARDVKVTSSGPALGEIISEGDLLDSNQNVLATFKQRFRAWWARPVVEVRIEIQPKDPPTGYPWHAFYGARFAWREGRTPLSRGVNFENCPTTHTRPETTEFIELRNGTERAAILTGGLPFLQRQGNRMLDLILIPEGETSRVFDIAIALDADDPILAARAFISPPLIVPVKKGPPHTGVSGWLFHVDASNVLVNSLRPAPDGADAVSVRLVEIRGVSTTATVRCPRNPVRAALVNELDGVLEELPVKGDAIELNFAANDMKRIRVNLG
jgi:hypothetical protein